MTRTTTEDKNSFSSVNNTSNLTGEPGKNHSYLERQPHIYYDKSYEEQCKCSLVELQYSRGKSMNISLGR